MEQFNTEIFLSDLTDETKDQLIENIIERLKDNKEEMEDISIIVHTGMVDDELEDEETRIFRTQQQLEERAEEILESTFFGEINIGD